MKPQTMQQALRPLFAAKDLTPIPADERAESAQDHVRVKGLLDVVRRGTAVMFLEREGVADQIKRLKIKVFLSLVKWADKREYFIFTEET